MCPLTAELGSRSQVGGRAFDADELGVAAMRGDAGVHVAFEHGDDLAGDVAVQLPQRRGAAEAGGRVAGAPPGPAGMLIGRTGSVSGGRGLLGLTTAKPLCGGSSRQSIIAPRNFSTLSGQDFD
jgi:hypothetical protein